MDFNEVFQTCVCSSKSLLHLEEYMFGYTLMILSSPRIVSMTSKNFMEKRFEITVNTEADHHLGVNMTALGDGSLQLTQSKLLKNIFTEYEHVLPTSNVRNRVPLNPTRASGNSEPFDRKQYLHLLGMLNYLLRSRPDIATAVSFAATKASNPTFDDYTAMLDNNY